MHFASLTLLMLLCIQSIATTQNTISATYSIGDIPTSFDTYDETCNGPSTVLEVTLPPGDFYEVVNTQVEYTMTALGSGWKSHQRSKIKCVNTETEESEVSGTGDEPGPFLYDRDIAVANGIYEGGSTITFEMWARRTFESIAGCNTSVNRVNAFTWTITVTYSDEITDPHVGINVDTPTTQLDIRTTGASSTTVLNLGSPDNGFFTQISNGNSADIGTRIYRNDSKSLSIGTAEDNGSDFVHQMYVDPAGNVGFGTDQPQAKVDIHSDDTFLMLSGSKPWKFSESDSALQLQPTNDGSEFRITSQDGLNILGEFKTDNTTSRIHLVPDSGRVSIGKRSAGAHLDVYSFEGTINQRDTAIIARALTIPQNSAQVGIYAETNGYNGKAIIGSTVFGTGVYGESTHEGDGGGIGVSGRSEGRLGTGVSGIANSETGTPTGVYGRTDGEAGSKGVYGLATDIEEGTTYGVYGKSESQKGVGVYGEALWPIGGAAYGVHGKAASGAGVYGESTSSGYSPGVKGTGDRRGIEGRAYDTLGIGIFGHNTSSTGPTIGVHGLSGSSSGQGIKGEATSSSGQTYGVYGESASSSGVGVKGIVTSSSGTNYGVMGETSSSLSSAVYGNTNGESAKAIEGYSTGQYGKGLKVEVTSTHSSANAILAVGDNGNAYAGYFIGRVNVAGNLSKSSGSFKIDHPLDPANKYLYHSFVESPDMMNIYNGNVITDGDGYATVTLPDYFDALNMEFRYQLTVIGDFAQAIVAEKVKSNSFIVRTDKPNIEVSWQVTGIRKDPWAQAHRIVPEVEKEPENIGKFLSPEIYGHTEAARINGPVRVNQK